MLRANDAANKQESLTAWVEALEKIGVEKDYGLSNLSKIPVKSTFVERNHMTMLDGNYDIDEVN